MTARRIVEEPRLGRWKLPRGPLLVGLLYAILLTAALVALFGSTRAHLVPGWLRAGAPVAFGVFLALFAAYRFALVRAGRYPAGKAFFQIGAGALFLMMLLPGTVRDFGREPLRPLSALLSDPDASVRALACEVARYRPEARVLARDLAARVDDPVPEVRRQALESLRSVAGSDVGGEGSDAAERWRRWAEGK